MGLSYAPFGPLAKRKADMGGSLGGRGGLLRLAGGGPRTRVRGTKRG
jgi:hypothetical protein